MAFNLIEKELQKDPSRYQRSGLRDIVQLAHRLYLESWGLKDVDVPIPNTERSMDILFCEFEHQVHLYQEFEYHKYLEISKGKFKDDIMKLCTPQPELFYGIADTPLVMFGNIPVREQLNMTGLPISHSIQWHLEQTNCLLTEGAQQEPHMYVSWVSPFKGYYRGGDLVVPPHLNGASIYEAVAYANVTPNILEKLHNSRIGFPGQFINIQGERMAEDWVILFEWRGNTMLDLISQNLMVPDLSSEHGGIMMCGKTE